MYIVRKKFQFCGAHILSDAYTTACKERVHGHNYVVEIFLGRETLDKTGMVVDFTRLKEVMNHYINTWDHRMVVHKKDPRRVTLMQNPGAVYTDFNPTAENMAHHFWEIVNKEFPKYYCKVRVHETDSGYAEFNPGGWPA